MRIPILSKGTWLAAAVTIAIAAALLFAQQATADTGAGPPGAPANPLAHLIVPEGGDPRVRLSWDAPGAPVSGYTVARADGRSFQAAGTATTYSDHSVKPGTSYTYAVTARNGQGSGASSAPASASVPDAPSQPGELAAEVAKIAATDESASVALTWTAPTVPAAAQCETSYPLDGYTILRSSDGSQETEIATPGSEAVSITDDTAAFGATYTYRVFARSAIGDSPAAEATVTVPARPVLPATGLTASIADPFDGNVSLSWDAPAEGPPTVGYLVVRYLGADPYQGTDLPITLDELATQTTLVDETAQAGVTYSYLALARSADNVGEPSNAAVIEAPAPATGVTATADNGTVSLTWETPAMGTPGNYRIQRKATGGEWTQVAETMDTAHTDDNAPADSSYAYRVQHRNQYGGSAWAVSNQISLLGIPPRVTGVTATVSSNDIVVAWQALADGTADNYQVTYGIEDGQDRETATVPNTDTSFTHPDNTEGATYQYQVRAVNSAGEGPWSDPVTARRLNLPPGAHRSERHRQRGRHHHQLDRP